MSGSALPLILNGLILVLLAATIFFAARLSLNLRDFRASRKDLDQLVRDLGISVTRAEGAIAGMRQTASESGRDLQELVNQARSLSEELQLMNEAGNNLAGRLEKAAERGGSSRHAAENAEPPVRGPFAIRDPEFERDGDEGGDDAISGLQSRAEKELFEALQGRRNKGGTGGAS